MDKINRRAKGQLKGFTLVELIVVMAIIAILAGVVNLATQGFIKNARRETANDKAHLLFTGFQNVLTQCEIKQDNSSISPTFANDAALTGYVTIAFKVYNGEVQCYTISSSAKTGTGAYISGTPGSGQYTGSMTTKYTDSSTGEANLPNAIGGIIDNTFDGEAKVYIDYDNFEVKSVLYKPMTDSERNSTYNISDSATELTNKSGAVSFDNSDKQETMVDMNGILYGAYPFWDNMA